MNVHLMNDFTKKGGGTDSHDDIAVTHRNTKIKTRALI